MNGDEGDPRSAHNSVPFQSQISDPFVLHARSNESSPPLEEREFRRLVCNESYMWVCNENCKIEKS